MIEHEGERRFRRVSFRSEAVLLDATGVRHPGQLHDLSLKGALFEIAGDWRVQVRETVELRLELSPEVVIHMPATVVHAEQAQVGLHCDEIDLDSMTALRRLVSLNTGDDTLLERELAELSRP